MQTRPHLQRLSASALALFFAAPFVGAQTTLYTLNGQAANDRLGVSVSYVGDLNADGKPEFVVGAPENGNVFTVAEGYARVYNGATGLSLYLFNGGATNDGFGNAVGASDVNNDGKPDVLVGAPTAGTAGNQTGRVYVYNGANGSSTPLFTFSGVAAGEQLGAAVAGAGDVNADGFQDVIVGAPAAASAKGLARVYSGQSGSVLYTINGVTNNDNLGFSVDGIGDVTGDGRSEFIVGSRLVGAKVYNGATGAVLYTIAAVGNDGVGTSAAGCGDVNNDGTPDFIVGAPQDGSVFSPGPGYAKVFSGASGALLWTVSGDANGDRFGWSVGSGRDVNSDGRADFLVGADQNSSNSIGYARLFSGATGTVIHTVAGVNTGERLGAAVDLVGDLNADGRGEFATGAPGTTNGANAQAGQVRVFSYQPGAAGSFEAFCFGDNLDPLVTTDCPCANFGSAGHGCANSANSTGALLAGAGVPVPDNVVLTATGMPGAVSCIFLQGDALTDTFFGDGVNCVGGSLIRLRTKTASGGAASFPDSTDTVTLSARGGVVPGSGTLRYYSTYYRNASTSFCPPATFNVTNGWKILW
ncbi:MAG: VCBS repeat-containing protein [Planctomycetes bacterium]|nr:VCBS repeat-containing protein [Planctomycetota bacterium]